MNGWQQNKSMKNKRGDHTFFSVTIKIYISDGFKGHKEFFQVLALLQPQKIVRVGPKMNDGK